MASNLSASQPVVSMPVSTKTEPPVAPEQPVAPLNPSVPDSAPALDNVDLAKIGSILNSLGSAMKTTGKC